MNDYLGAVLSACSVAIDGRSPLIVSLFLAGLVGSGTHCAFMCGPFVLAQTAARMAALPVERLTEWRRLIGAAALPYQLGRMTTYCALGAIGGGLSGGLFAARWLGPLSSAMLVLAAVGMVSYALGGAGLRLGFAGRIGDHLARLAAPFSRHPFGWRGYVFGLILGLLPCGLLYSALAAAMSAGSALAGAILMGAFVAGTVPALVLVGYLGSLTLNRFRAAARPFTVAILLVNAAVLLFLAWLPWRDVI